MKYESFNIEPGQTSWFDMPEDYKKAYFAQKFKTQHNYKEYPHEYKPKEDYSYTKDTDNIWRVYDPLKPQTSKSINCVVHIPVHVEDRKRDSDSQGVIEDFVVSKRCIEHFRTYVISEKIPDFKLDLVVSINGKINQPKFIEYFNSIDNQWLQPKVFCRVFQRPNIGYQWGGFHDVWMRYKDIDCPWFVTMEADHRFMDGHWFDMITSHLGDGQQFTFGKCQNDRYLNPETPVGTPVPVNTWRNADGSPKTNVTSDDLIHTCGALHFCHRNILAKIDNAFGCFTFSMGNSHGIDGIIQGEIAFCQKIKAFGYSIKSKQIEFCVRPMRGQDCQYNPKNDHIEVQKEVKLWRW